MGISILADLNIARTLFRRRARATALCALFSLVSVLTGLTWLASSTWNTPYRYTVLAALTIGCAVIAAVAGFYGGLWSRSARSQFEHVRAEWKQDRAALSNLLHSEAADVPQDAP